MTASELAAGADGKEKVTKEPVFMQMFPCRSTKEQREQVMSKATEIIWCRACFLFVLYLI